MNSDKKEMTSREILDSILGTLKRFFIEPIKGKTPLTKIVWWTGLILLLSKYYIPAPFYSFGFITGVVLITVAGTGVFQPEFSFHQAAEQGKIESVQSLLNKGIDVNIQNTNHETALNLACESGQLEMVKFLQSKSADINLGQPLVKAVKNNHLEIVKFLLMNGALLDSQDASGQTALHQAIRLSTEETVLSYINLLIEHGANINIGDNDQATPLHYAIDQEYLEVMTTLLRNGAEVNARLKDARTPLTMAIAKENQEAVKILRDFDAIG
ncbi:MAG: ankyrin repeat domain-containing protein [Cyanobacteria bacterium P01_G01_bin.54]